jgi:hypothetical protein
MQTTIVVDFLMWAVRIRAAYAAEFFEALRAEFFVQT